MRKQIRQWDWFRISTKCKYMCIYHIHKLTCVYHIKKVTRVLHPAGVNTVLSIAVRILEISQLGFSLQMKCYKFIHILRENGIKMWHFIQDTECCLYTPMFYNQDLETNSMIKWTTNFLKVHVYFLRIIWDLKCTSWWMPRVGLFIYMFL